MTAKILVKIPLLSPEDVKKLLISISSYSALGNLPIINDMIKMILLWSQEIAINFCSANLVTFYLFVKSDFINLKYSNTEYFASDKGNYIYIS